MTTIDINTPEKLADLRKALARALNTWDDGPRWLFELADMIEPEHEIRVSNGLTIDLSVLRDVRDNVATARASVAKAEASINQVIGGAAVAFGEPPNKHAIDQAVRLFLGWRLPVDFAPDNGIHFASPSVGWPTGTNLLTAAQAEVMFKHCLGFKA